MERGEEKTKRWRIGTRHLIATTTGIASSLPFLMLKEPIAFGLGLLLLLGTFSGLLNVCLHAGSFLTGFSYGFGIPLMVVLYVSVIVG